MRRNQVFPWLLYLSWAVFVNACNVWLIRPLAADFAIYGILVIFAIAAMWVLSIPALHRRKWIVFTVFSLLFGDGFSEILGRSGELGKIVLGIAMLLSLTLLGWLVARWKYRYFFGAALLLAVLNLILPLDEWPFLTHFQVVYRTQLAMHSTDIPALPLQPIQTPNGTSVVTLNNVDESQKQAEAVAEKAVDSPDALENALRDYGHRYEMVELVQNSGRFSLQPVPTEQLGYIDPLDFTTSFFPFIRAYWTSMNGHVVQYMAPSQSPNVLTDTVSQAGYLPAMFTAFGANTVQQEQENWRQLLETSGEKSHVTGLEVEDGKLTGTYGGLDVSIPVQAFAVVGYGSFTAAGAHEVLLQGVNRLQVVSLDANKVVSAYVGNLKHPLPSDVVIGAIDNSGRDVVFVNSEPAMILRPNADADWTEVYTAPNSSLRFEAAVRLPGDSIPEVITTDPSYIRNSDTRYFSSYQFENGQLERNWRVYRTSVVNVHPVQFSPSGPEYLVADIYGSGKMFVLRPHRIPVVPLTSGILAVCIAAGWGLRIRMGRKMKHA